MILDFHCHIGKARYSYKPKEFTPEHLLQRMDQANVDMACCFSFYEPEMINNEFVAECGKRFDRLIPFAFVNPHLAKSVEELEKLARDKLVQGIKLHPYIHGYHANNTFLLDPVFEVTKKYNLPILCHTFSESPNNMPTAIGYMAGRFPQVNIVMAHGGFMWARREAENEAEKHPNLYIGTTNLLPWTLRDGIDQLGPEKYVFESDTPWGDARVEIAKLKLIAKSDRELELMLWENGARLVGITKG